MILGLRATLFSLFSCFLFFRVGWGLSLPSFPCSYLGWGVSQVKRISLVFDYCTSLDCAGYRIVKNRYRTVGGVVGHVVTRERFLTHVLLFLR